VAGTGTRVTRNDHWASANSVAGMLYPLPLSKRPARICRVNAVWKSKELKAPGDVAIALRRLTSAIASVGTSSPSYPVLGCISRPISRLSRPRVSPIAVGSTDRYRKQPGRLSSDGFGQAEAPHSIPGVFQGKRKDRTISVRRTSSSIPCR